MTDDLHPSFLELDRASIGVASSSTQEHLRRCTRCADHVKAVQVQLPIPAWLQHQAGGPRRPIWGAPWAWIGLAATTVVVGIMVFPQVKGAREEKETLVPKAANPSIAVYVKRGERVMLWSGDVPLEPGDMVRLQVAPEGYSHIVVTTVDAAGTNQVLYEGDLEPKGPTFLPVSWKLDDSQKSESLEITLSFGSRGNDSANRGRSAWKKKLVLSKHGGF